MIDLLQALMGNGGTPKQTSNQVEGVDALLISLSKTSNFSGELNPGFALLLLERRRSVDPAFKDALDKVCETCKWVREQHH